SAVFAAYGTGAICVGLGPITAMVGTLACGIVVVGAASFGAGAAVGMGGEKMAERIYEVSK
ncbi:MAG: hypothetical protein JWQ69_4991, partial [Pseudomonas sp.]|nr:hypothetical protein [Pseudomonas sp.]